MSFLFSFERKAAKTLAMHAASRAHTEKSATEGGATGALVRAVVLGRVAGLVGGKACGPKQGSGNGPRDGAMRCHAAAGGVMRCQEAGGMRWPLLSTQMRH